METSSGRIELHFDNADEMIQWARDLIDYLDHNEDEEDMWDDMDGPDDWDALDDYSTTTEWMGY